MSCSTYVLLSQFGLPERNQMNPFDDDSADFYVLANDEEQYSLWPVSVSIPSGWKFRIGPVSREQALAYVREAVRSRPRQ